MSKGKPFIFKQFQVGCDRSAMKLGTDGVLLGAWCDAEDVRKVLDVGTGCGVIALMVAQRNPHAVIDAVDIDPDSILDAGDNCKSSPWEGRINIYLADFNEWVGQYDLIVSNPPFFDNGPTSPSQARSVARHTRSLSYEQLISRSREMLTPHGRLALITPVEYRSQIYEIAAFNSMGITRMCDVIPVAGKPPKRVLWELTTHETALRRESLTIVDADRKYTEQYAALCHEFYINV